MYQIYSSTSCCNIYRGLGGIFRGKYVIWVDKFYGGDKNWSSTVSFIYSPAKSTY